jgi:hypothetical protein
VICHAIAERIFVGEPGWTWRRRITVTAALTFITGILNSIFFDSELAHAAMVMSNCSTGLVGTLATFGTMAVVDDHLKRKAAPVEEHQP